MNKQTPGLDSPPRSPGLHDREQFERLLMALNERQRRHCVALESIRLGWGGDTRMSELTGMSIPTIRRGRREILGGETACLSGGRVRKPGGGRRRVEDLDSKVERDLGELVEPDIAGDPCNGRKWVRSSLVRLTERLRAMGHRIGKMSVRRLLKKRDALCVRATSASRARPTRTATGNSATSRLERLPS